MSGSSPGLAILLLAAGRSTRMGGPNKLLQDWRGQPLVRHAAASALATGAPVFVVTGHQAGVVADALAGLDVTLVHNPDFATGLSTSLRAGFAALPPDAARVAVMLGDMPLVGSQAVVRLALALADAPEAVAAVPVVGGAWGNPVVMSRALEPSILALTGDAGARKVLESQRERVIECPLEDDAALTDIDTPEALRALRDR